jgi:SM-20-related protein
LKHTIPTRICATDINPPKSPQINYLPCLYIYMHTPHDLLIDSYLENRIGIDTAFLSETLSNGLQENIRNLQADNLMHFAGVGNETINDTAQKMRSDQIYWMDKSHDNIYEQEFLSQIESFIKRLNTTCYAGINGYEFHYAVYAEGAGYKRHRDQFKNDTKRKFSLINYLNTGWQEADGGELLVYQNNATQKIQPHAQTAVFFKSEEMEHEVAQAHKSRMSITGWLKRL